MQISVPRLGREINIYHNLSRLFPLNRMGLAAEMFCVVWKYLCDGCIGYKQIAWVIDNCFRLSRILLSVSTQFGGG